MRYWLWMALPVLAACAAAPRTPTSVLAATGMGSCDARRAEEILSEHTAAFHQRNPVPGLSAAAIVPGVGSSAITAAVGHADPDSHRALRPGDRMLAGSVGKTFFAAAALQLAEQGRLNLDAPIRSYLQGRRIPNDEAVTPRMLLSHRSGYPAYDAEFMRALIEAPLRVRGFDDWAGPIRRGKALGLPGERYDYSDVNYVMLAQVIEGAAGEPAGAYIQRTLLGKLGLRDTVPADGPVIEGLVPGFEGKNALFGADRVLDASGLRFNPQFESGGGGFASTPSDLARWVAALHAGRAVSAEAWKVMSTPASQGAKGKLYGSGIHIDRTPLGIAYGHSGYIPGYLSWVRFYPQTGIAVAVQTNTSDDARLPEDGYTLVDSLGEALAQSCTPGGSDRIRAAARAIQEELDRSRQAASNKEHVMATHVFDAYVERLELEGDRATVWTHQLWERDMQGKDGQPALRTVTAARHREEWVEAPAGWRFRAAEELGSVTLVNGKRD